MKNPSKKEKLKKLKEIEDRLSELINEKFEIIKEEK